MFSVSTEKGIADQRTQALISRGTSSHVLDVTVVNSTTVGKLHQRGGTETKGIDEKKSDVPRSISCWKINGFAKVQQCRPLACLIQLLFL